MLGRLGRNLQKCFMNYFVMNEGGLGILFYTCSLTGIFGSVGLVHGPETVVEGKHLEWRQGQELGIHKHRYLSGHAGSWRKPEIAWEQSQSSLLEQSNMSLCAVLRTDNDRIKADSLSENPKLHHVLVMRNSTVESESWDAQICYLSSLHTFVR